MCRSGSWIVGIAAPVCHHVEKPAVEQFGPVLKFLTQNKGKVYSIDEIYTNIWEEESFAAENIIAVHIRHIREKIEVNPKEPKYLKVIWGVGYKVENL